MKILLTRIEFRERCLKRDNYSCVICSFKENLSVHHIIERRLFSAVSEYQGYFIDNGSTLCEPCHILAESTLLTCDEIRKACNISKTILPISFNINTKYDKWGNPYITDDLRGIGPLFYSEPFQKLYNHHNLKDQFEMRIKYPRTYHLTYSQGSTSDDKTLSNHDHFNGKEVVLTEKMDGENTTMYSDYIHARSLDSNHHPSRDWIKQFHSTIAYHIPENFRICGENLYALHSINYEKLISYFYGFSIWNSNLCLSWNDTLEYFELLGITPVKELYRGIYDEDKIKSILTNLNTDVIEGGVLRLADSFHYNDFKTSVAKYVRKNHVQTDEHWAHKEIIPNKMINN